MSAKNNTNRQWFFENEPTWTQQAKLGMRVVQQDLYSIGNGLNSLQQIVNNLNENVTKTVLQQSTASTPSNSGGGSVSVGLIMPSEFGVAGSPVVNSGVLTVYKNSENINTVWAGPANGNAAAPSFRALVSADLPLATASLFGAVKPDNSTITISGGVITAVGGNNGGNGTVTSVGLVMPAEFTVSGSPVTTAGNLTVTKANENINLVYAGPANGAAAAPTFRALVAADLPANTGTVTSVGLSMPAEFVVSGSPVTTSGNFNVTKANETANTIYAGPTSGANAAPTFRALVVADTPTSVQNGVLGIVIDGGGSTPSTGSKGFLQAPYSCTITGWTVLADQSGSASITVKKSTYAGFPTTTSIVASAPPNLSSAQKNTSTTLTGWTTTITAGDVLEFNLSSVATVTRIILELQVTRI